MAFLHCDFYSDVLGFSTSMNVILPQNTKNQIGMRSTSRRTHHPVLYLLHGLTDDHTIWHRRTSIERYAAGYDLIVIMPNVHRSFYTDMHYGYDYWTFISEELPAVCKGFFPISTRPEDTFAAGLSMGGYGAFKLALNYPERFAAAASLSGLMDIDAAVESRHFPHDMQLVFGNSKPRDSQDDLFALAARTSPETAPKLFQCCGTDDSLYEQNKRFQTFAQSLNLPLTYQEGPGGHDWEYWDRQIRLVLEWLPL
ncbi:MAG: alpha/beta hydrolase [Fibrobacterota bacterium]